MIGRTNLETVCDILLEVHYVKIQTNLLLAEALTQRVAEALAQYQWEHRQ